MDGKRLVVPHAHVLELLDGLLRVLRVQVPVEDHAANAVGHVGQAWLLEHAAGKQMQKAVQGHGVFRQLEVGNGHVDKKHTAAAHATRAGYHAVRG